VDLVSLNNDNAPDRVYTNQFRIF